MNYICLRTAGASLVATVVFLLSATLSAVAQRTVDLPQLVTEPQHVEYVSPQNSVKPSITNVRSANPSVATASAYGRGRVQVVGVAPGEATIEFFDAAERVQYRIRVSVRSSSPTANAGLDKSREKLPDVTMLIKTTQNVASPVAASNNINSVTSSDPAVATARTNTPKTVQIYAVGLGDTYVNFDDRGRRFQVHVWVRDGAASTSGAGAGVKTAKLAGPGDKKNEGPQPIVKKNEGPAPVKGGNARIDACLVGTWVTATLNNDFTHWDNGGGGIVVSFKPDGHVTVDYAAMQPNQAGPKTTSWRGNAAGRITTASGKIHVAQVDASNIDTTYTVNGAVTYQGHLDGLGNVLQAAVDHDYKCDRTSLSISSKVWRSTLTKEQ